MDKWLTISITTATFNGERVIEKFLNLLVSQDYPLDKMEILLGDGGSKDKTLEIIKKFQKKYPKNIKLIHNKKQYSEGRGMGKDQLTRMAKGEFLVILDQDNLLVQRDWIKKAISILVENPEIKGVQSRMMASKSATATNKYLNFLGIEDPFATDYSLNAQITLNPKKFFYNKKGEFYVYNSNIDNFLYAGGDGFVIRKKDLMEIRGYTQDIDNFYRMALKKYKIAIPKNLRFYHKTSIELIPYLKKRWFFVQYYILENKNERDFNWISNKNNFNQNLKFFKAVLFNLIIIPRAIEGAKMALKERKNFWLLHSFIPFLITLGYIYSFFYVKIFKKMGVEFKH